MDDELLIEFLKKTNCRISGTTRWLYWDESNEQWVVQSREPYQKVNRCKYTGNNLREALEALEEGWQNLKKDGIGG